MEASIPERHTLTTRVCAALQLAVVVYDDMYARIHERWRDAMAQLCQQHGISHFFAGVS